MALLLVTGSPWGCDMRTGMHLFDKETELRILLAPCRDRPHIFLDNLQGGAPAQEEPNNERKKDRYIGPCCCWA